MPVRRYTRSVPASSLLDNLSPYARLTTAVAPFFLALVMRILLGNNRLTRVLFSISATWLAINVMLTPYSRPMQHDLQNLRGIFR